MKGIVGVFLPILCSFLNISLTAACHIDNDCYTGRCCKFTAWETGICINRKTCDGFCVYRTDCSAPEMCDINRYLCTSECNDEIQCLDGDVCDKNHCVSKTKVWFYTKEATGFIMVFATITAIAATISLIRRFKSRRNADNVNTNATVASTNSSPEYVELLDRPQIPDAVTQGAPPSYAEVHSRPEAPPPTYDEVQTASTEV